ncbi:hypothetical protein J14TS2_37070 [Bacillus sp. J14TS2]|uniref:nucleotidyltransferase domain-containing protein n=1 Tax=Bacillus sp. J14TS2 TaxID=2807188 RepID=UPI001B003AD2|nr:nucleotidyltransferase family protein [Bacillus sp. J14TS2]GIN73232.1 hypothetical protein J14TS2_37070 [Bacillus sp. J14TS2]
MNKLQKLDLGNVPQELKLMLEWVNEQNNEEIDWEKFQAIDWDFFVQLAIHHRLYPLLATKIKDDPRVPENVQTTLTNLFKQNTYRMLHLCAEIEGLGQLFKEKGIRSLFLKGPLLAEDLYGDISKRTSGDLDVLIPIHQLEQTENLLIAQGYQKDEYIQSLLNDWKWRHHHFTYYHPIQGTKIEIHWRLNPAPSREPSFAELWDRKRRSLLTNSVVYMLSKEDLFFFLVTHGARHGWSRLRWLVDIHKLTQQGLDWRRILKQLRKYQVCSVGGQSLILSQQLLKTNITEEMRSFFKGRRPLKLAEGAVYYVEKMVHLHSDPVPKEVAEYHAKHLFSLMPNRQKTFYLLSTLYPYYTDAETLALPTKFHFLYFPLRPFLWLWRKTKKKPSPKVEL